MILEAVCVELMNKYQAEREEKTEQQVENSQTVQNDVQEWADLIRKYRYIDTLDREILLRLVEKIEVGERRIVDGTKEREIRIYYKFVGYIG